MSKIYPTTLFASKIEATLVVKLQMMVTFLWWMKASFPSCSKIPLDEVSAPSVPSLLYPPPPQKKDRQVRRAFFFGREPIIFHPCTSWERGIKSSWNFYLSLLRVRIYVVIRVDRVVEDILRGTLRAARAWKWYRLECYIENIRICFP